MEFCRTFKFLLVSAHLNRTSSNFAKYLPVRKFSLLATVLYISVKHSPTLNSDSVCFLLTSIGRNRHDKKVKRNI